MVFDVGVFPFGNLHDPAAEDPLRDIVLALAGDGTAMAADTAVGVDDHAVLLGRGRRLGQAPRLQDYHSGPQGRRRGAQTTEKFPAIHVLAKFFHAGTSISSLNIVALMSLMAEAAFRAATFSAMLFSQ